MSFFGPLHSWRELILEEFFALQLHLNMSYSEVKQLPIQYRKWFLGRLVKHFNDKNDVIDSRRSKNDNTQQENPLSKLSQFESQMKSKL